jgi:para-nitrobenzyl esterase
MNVLRQAAPVAGAILLAALVGPQVLADQIKTANGIVEGTLDKATGVRMFKGIPFASPPVGDLRWKAPQPPASWEGVRDATGFGPRCMQQSLFGDMNFRSNGMGEDCLYLNVWTPAKSADEHLPVLVYYYGGGFQAGDGSEPRYDGESMATRGIVAVTVNYRLGIFGFFAHPELAAESPHHAAGNYGLLDQNAALHWVHDNIAAFGGDPAKITIAGESAGSVSVSGLMASPLSRDIIAGAIGESGALISRGLGPKPLAESEKDGEAFVKGIGLASLAALRAMSAEDLLGAVAKGNPYRFGVNTDGYFLPKPPAEIFAAGEQAHVPLLAGWNSEEMTYLFLMGRTPLTPETFAAKVKELYPGHGDEVLRAYASSTPDELIQAATDLAGDRFIAFSTWKWLELDGATSGKPTYRYYFERARPPMVPEMKGAVAGLAGGVIKKPDANVPKMPPARGAVHSAEIEYALGNLDSNKVYAWTPDDHKISATMEAYFANFIKTGDPNGAGLAKWPAANSGDVAQVMHINVDTRAEPDAHRARYLLLDKLSAEK